MDNPIDFNLLKVFVTVYRHRSITLAADAMGLTQPGVSGILKRLQEQLGVTLFTRDGRGIAPTHHAHELARQVEPALSQIHNALEGLESFGPQTHRKFVIYVPEPLMLVLLPKLEQDTTLGNIEIVLHPMQHSLSEQLTHLNQQQADLVIDFAHHSAASFFSEKLMEDEICVIARKGHPRITGKLSPLGYYQEKHITLKLRREDVYLADYFTEELLNERKVAAECDSMMVQMSLVASSDYIAVVTKSLATQFADVLGLQVIEAPLSGLPITYRLMVHNREKNSPANQWLRETLKHYFRSQ
ncbi:LysR family transcriptional regulator [Vibrio vulnificus]|uniref:LysR family transcriptional regulator n=1 Tax=Vibrio vulnificus TaxID=672 RepID=UPI0005FBA540|nr:LysR family transcriptional regulator [Vibrio vulnificus]EHH2449223.1 LysR family transcriptional regulator [Vibrio vulnificus]EIZ4667115.1 LysR family transcriptional regulator [Vibrio vulnificus]